MVINLQDQQAGEYSGCGHAEIQGWNDFSAIIGGVQSGEITKVRESLHDTGHFTGYGEIGAGRSLDGVRNLHLGLHELSSRIADESDQRQFTVKDAQIAALQIRLTSLGLIDSHGKMPDLELITSIWSQISIHPDSAMKGIVVANVMAVFKKADEIATPAGSQCQYSRSSEFAGIVMKTSAEEINSPRPSGLRRWFVQSLYTGYHNALFRHYQLMLKFGDSAEIDVALSSLETFSRHTGLGGNRRGELVKIYSDSITELLSGANKHISADDLTSKIANYGSASSIARKCHDLLAEMK